jgi:hypothetical protein
MSTIVDTTTLSTAHNSDINVPVNLDNSPITWDGKELVLSVGGYRYVVFAIDEFTRYVFIEFIKLKSEADEAIARIKAAFDAKVYTPVDEDGRVLPSPPYGVSPPSHPIIIELINSYTHN